MAIPIDRLLGRHAPAPDFSDPIRLLVHCHARIEGHLGALARAADRLRARGGAADPEVTAAVGAALRHFAVAGTLHTEDEEQSLFPRLRASGGAAGADALAAVQALEAQHRLAEGVHAALDAAGRPLVAGAGTEAPDRFGSLVADLRDLYGPHIRVENVEVFPVAARVLAPGALQAIGAEMRARRRRAGIA